LPTIVEAQSAAAAREPARTRVVVMGVTHSAQLVAESYQPAVFRAFMARVAPAAVLVERDPESLARGSHHDFTYEIQHIALPWAAERRIPVHPFDWVPDEEDERLAFGITFNPPPAVRRPGGFQDFIHFDSATLRLPLFYAESDSVRASYSEWYDRPAEEMRHDFARRLFLYRTFLQARRIAQAARLHPGATVLVLVGSYHTDDIEKILQGDPRIELVRPSTFGEPAAEEVAREVRAADLFAIATFNLLGVQSKRGGVNWEWVGRVVGRLAGEARSPETALLETRLGVLTGRLAPEEAAARYAAIAGEAAADARFTWDGVLDRSRLDSYFDPFGNLTVRRRALLEGAREETKRGRAAVAAALRTRAEEGLTPLQRAQLGAHWDDHLAGMR
ncbi:MAG TPA: hypothetical protein VFR81_00255, partial [Longimicrobium sp.]|nr:hypothetical protein [Longimicrobium sp.]